MYTYTYIYICVCVCVCVCVLIRITATRKSGIIWQTEHWTAVSTLLGLINIL